jgi:hypothetical protein
MDDTITLNFFTRKKLRQKPLSKRLLQLLFTYDKRFSPEYIGVGNGWKRVTEKKIEDIVRFWPKQLNVSFERRTTFASTVVISLGQLARGGYSTFHFWLDTSYFVVPNRLGHYLEFSLALYDLLSPSYGSIHPTGDAIAMKTVVDPKYGRMIVPTDLNKGLPAVYWGNFFGPDYVSLIGRISLLKLRSSQTIELNDGGILILTTPTPLELDHELQTQIKKEIGEDFFYKWEYRKR